MTRSVPVAVESAAADLRHYTPEEVTDPEGEFRLPMSTRTLCELAYGRKVPHHKSGGRIRFKRWQIRAVSEMYDVPAVADRRTA